MSIISRLAALALALMVFPWAGVRGGNVTAANSISGKAHYVSRDGLRIYLWEKRKAGLQDSFAASGKVALLVHGGTWSGRPDFDLQIRDYSLMDWLATNGYDVWAIDIHGYGHSDKTDKDWSGVQSAAADIDAAVEYITKLRGVSTVDLLGWSAGTQRAGLYAMQHPERVAKLILYAPHWKGSAEYRERVRKRIDNGGKPLGQYRINTEMDARVISWTASWPFIRSSKRTSLRSMRRRRCGQILSRRMHSSTTRIFPFWIRSRLRCPP